MEYSLVAAWLMGFLGSLHCVGMCGGLVGALNMQRATTWWPGLWAYQCGRIVVYSSLGMLVALLGVGLKSLPFFAQIQTGVMVFAGLMMIAFALNLGGWMADPFAQLASKLMVRLGFGRLMAAVSKGKGVRPWFAIGLMNGLLPCGLVYAALSATLMAPSLWHAGLWMTFFGLGTVPA
ncbi:MAG: sulfite exporter TauE/SafE family protein, partial [Zetaproteobacteria bacterium]|nr:sulfite exporter TauE/SafE family protein [Zetaproteobacteria bacterium]